MSWQHTLRLLQTLDRAWRVFESDHTDVAAANLNKAVIEAKRHELISAYEYTQFMKKVSTVTQGRDVA